MLRTFFLAPAQVTLLSHGPFTMISYFLLRCFLTTQRNCMKTELAAMRKYCRRCIFHLQLSERRQA